MQRLASAHWCPGTRRRLVVLGRLRPPLQPGYSGTADPGPLLAASFRRRLAAFGAKSAPLHTAASLEFRSPTTHLARAGRAAGFNGRSSTSSGGACYEEVPVGELIRSAGEGPKYRGAPVTGCNRAVTGQKASNGLSVRDHQQADARWSRRTRRGGSHEIARREPNRHPSFGGCISWERAYNHYDCRSRRLFD